MPTAPRIAIVTPSLNQGAYIAETIASVLSQGGVSLEYVVVDGGSTDGTLEILRQHSGRLRWVSEHDAGQSAAINKGWRMTEGDIVTWLNADDTYRPGALSQVAAFFAAHPEVDVVYGECDYVDSRGRVMGRYPTRPWDYLTLVRSTISFLPQPATFLRRRVVESIGYLDETLSYVMDFDYWLRLGMQHRVVHLPVSLATLRLHASAKSVQAVARFAPELVRIYQRLFARPDLPPAVRAIEAEAKSNIYYRAAHCAFWAGQAATARAYAARSWRQRPANLRALLLLTLSHAVGRACVQRVRPNPFARGLQP
jgi:glycosyltransferase involved in cell wall biosynthesis